MKKSILLATLACVAFIPSFVYAQTWTEVVLPPALSGTHAVVCMKVYNDELYAGTYTTGVPQLWKFDGTSWTEQSIPGFSATNRYIKSMEVYDDSLFIGTINGSAAAQVFKLKGKTWTLQSIPGFSASNQGVISMTVYDNSLFIGTYSASGAELWKFDGTTWSRQIIPGFQSTNQEITAMREYYGALYFGTFNLSGAQLWKFDGTTWAKQAIPGATNQIGGMAVYDHSLFVGVFEPVGVYSIRGPARLLKYDGVSWSEQTIQGSLAFGIVSMAVHNNFLFAGTWTDAQAIIAIWKFDGKKWTKEIVPESFDPSHGVFDFAVYNDLLYVTAGYWTQIFRLSPPPIDPAEGTLGTRITLAGTGFGAKKNKVLLGNTSLKITEWSDELIRCSIPKAMAAGVYNLTIQPSKAAPIVLEQAFTVVPPDIGAVSPTTASTNEEITISGSFFGTKKGKVTLGQKNCRVTGWTMEPVTGEGEIKAIVPKGLASGPHVLKVMNGVGSDSVDFNTD